MAKYSRAIGVTSEIFRVFVADSGSTAGAGKTGIVAASINAHYHSQATTAAVAITLATIATMNVYRSGDWGEVDSTNLPGVYEFHPPNACFASGVGKNVLIMLKGGASMAPLPMEIDLQADCNVTHVGGTAITSTGGRMEVNTSHISGDSTAADNLETAFDDTAGSVPWMGIIDQGTLQSAATTVGALRAAAAFADNELNGAMIVITSGTGVGQRRFISTNTGDNIVVDPAWTTDPGAAGYKIYATAPAPTTALPAVNVSQWANTSVATPTVAGVPEVDLTHVAGSTTSVSVLATNVADILVDTAEIGAAGAGLTNINLPNQTMDIVGNITGNLSGSVGSVTGAVGSVTGNVGGNVAGSVGSVTGAVGSVTGNVGGNVAGSVASVTAEVDANVVKVNDVTITGDGSGTPFGV
jgi:uncharacterized protein YjbJ (UPF0337 family)